MVEQTSFYDIYRQAYKEIRASQTIQDRLLNPDTARDAFVEIGLSAVAENLPEDSEIKVVFNTKGTNYIAIPEIRGVSLADVDLEQISAAGSASTVGTAGSVMCIGTFGTSSAGSASSVSSAGTAGSAN